MKSSNLSKNYKNFQKKNIALIGHMGSGKSLIGKLIAKKLHLEFFDSDSLIEKKANKSIKEIFDDINELGFRQIEEETILELKNEKKFVLSLGGGAILSEKVRMYLHNCCITIFLDTNIKTLIKRLNKSSKRPLLNNVSIENKLKKLDKYRRKYYLLADIILKNLEDREEIITTLIEKYSNLYEKHN